MRLGTVLAALLVTSALRPCAVVAEPGDDRFAVAANHYGAERWDLAVKEFRALLSEFPEFSRRNEAHFFAAESLIQARRYDEAAERFQLFVKQAPDHDLAPRAQFRQGEALYLAGKLAAALPPLDAFATQNPEHPLATNARRYLAHAHLAAAEADQETDTDAQSEHLSAARKFYAAALANSATRGAAQDVSSYPLHFGLARVDHIEQHLDKAKNGYETLLNCPDAVIAAQAHFYLGEILSVETDHAAAAAAYEGVLNVAPDSRWAQAIRGPLVLEYAQAGDFVSARSAMDRWITAVAPESPDRDTTSTVARLARRAGENEWAEQLFQQLTDTAEGNEQRTRGLRELAATQINAGQLEQAAVTLAELVKAHPQVRSKAESAYLLATTLHKLKRTGPALEAYLSVSELCPECPQAARSMYRAALLYEAQDEKPRAVELYERLAQQPQSPTWNQQEISTALYRWAWLLHESGDTHGARQRFTELHDRHPESKFWPDATYRVAEQAFADGDLPRTRKLLAGLLDDTRRTEIHPHALYLDARAAQASDDWAAMQKPLQQLLDDHPESELRLSAQYWLAESAYHLEEYDQARQRFDRLANELENAPSEWRWNVPLRQAQLAAAKKQWQQVRQHCTDIVEHAPADFGQLPEVHYLLGRFHVARAEFDDARQAFRRVAPSDGGVKTETAAMAQWMIGEAYMHQQDYPNAIAEYFRVEALYAYPRWQAAALLQAGKCYEQQDKRAEAVKQYRRILEQYPETTFAKEATQRLQEAP